MQERYGQLQSEDHLLIRVQEHLWSSQVSGLYMLGTSFLSCLRLKIMALLILLAWNVHGSFLESCRMHAQAITLAVLSGAAIYHYYEKQGESAAHEVSTVRK